MASVSRFQGVWLLAGAAALAAGCVQAKPPAHLGTRPLPADELHAGDPKGAPPPHAAAHGLRHRQDAEPGEPGAARIAFDSERGFHVVVGYPDHYWDAGRYFRLKRGEWRVADHVEGPWVRVEARDVPLALVRAADSKDVYPAQRAD